jgi:excisionase family DNA binding protein
VTGHFTTTRDDDRLMTPGDVAALFEPDRLLTPGEVAAIFRVDSKTVSRWAAAGKLPCIKTPGGHNRFERAVVLALLDGSTP